jgi:hypothetical protein
MKIAYIISAYKLPEQLVRLVKRLNTVNVCFFIHIDKKTCDNIYWQVYKELSEFKNVYFLSRHVCYRCSFGHVLATIKGIREIFVRNIPFDYLVLLTGQDYPIKNNSYIEKVFEANKGKIFLANMQLPCPQWEKENGGLDRFQFWHLGYRGRGEQYLRFPIIGEPRNIIKRLKKRLVNKIFPKRIFPKSLNPYGGSSYWCLPYGCVVYLYDFIKKNTSFVNFFKFVYIPDEIFFHTIILNSFFKTKVINDDLRYIIWGGNRAPYPAILNKEDIPNLIKSDKLFARKFDITADAEVLDLIDSIILKC